MDLEGVLEMILLLIHEDVALLLHELDECLDIGIHESTDGNDGVLTL
jgi:hypothetical protein